MVDLLAFNCGDNHLEDKNHDVEKPEDKQGVSDGRWAEK
jgi:hypothetical protein